MTETGWPLIPREVLPAPVKAARRRLPARPEQSTDAGRQIPFFGAGTAEPSPADLAGLLTGPGRLDRMGGTARVSVPVDAAWRVHVLVAELVIRGLVVKWRPLDDQDQEHSEDVRDDAHPDREEPITVPAGPTPPDVRPADPDADGEQTDESGTQPDQTEPAEVRTGRGFEVGTAYSRRLNGLARAWPEAAAQLFLTGARLRLWVAAAGEPVPGGYALGLDPAKDLTEIDAALVRAGLAGRVSDDGRRYLIMGKRRLRRLAELVGDRPAAAPEHRWPGSAGA